MKVNSKTAPVTFYAEGGAKLVVDSTTLGEPYRKVLQFAFEDDGNYVSVELGQFELIQLQKLLNQHLEGGRR